MLISTGSGATTPAAVPVLISMQAYRRVREPSVPQVVW
jgi:hypothetical protein